jgi:gamma-glutamyl phosphate reductase
MKDKKSDSINITLKEFFEEKILGIEKANILALETVKIARELDAKALEKRLEILNHFKDEMREMAADFLTQDKYDIHNKRSDEIFTELKNKLDKCINESDFSKIIDKINCDIQALKDAKIKSDTIASEVAKIAEGKASKKGMNIAIAISIISVLGTILGIILDILLRSGH